MNQREIKIRVWSKLTHLMSPTADFAEWIRQYQLTPHMLPQAHFHPNAAVLMQYTGLKDKNGKEIYEGDVVKYYGTFPKESLHEVYFVNAAFRIEPEGDGHYGSEDLLDSNYENLEVIGNIYENPDLLNNRQQ